MFAWHACLLAVVCPSFVPKLVMLDMISKLFQPNSSRTVMLIVIGSIDFYQNQIIPFHFSDLDLG